MPNPKLCWFLATVSGFLCLVSVAAGNYGWAAYNGVLCVVCIALATAASRP